MGKEPDFSGLNSAPELPFAPAAENGKSIIMVRKGNVRWDSFVALPHIIQNFANKDMYVQFGDTKRCLLSEVCFDVTDQEQMTELMRRIFHHEAFKTGTKTLKLNEPLFLKLSDVQPSFQKMHDGEPKVMFKACDAISKKGSCLVTPVWEESIARPTRLQQKGNQIATVYGFEVVPDQSGDGDFYLQFSAPGVEGMRSFKTRFDSTSHAHIVN